MCVKLREGFFIVVFWILYLYFLGEGVVLLVFGVE